MSSWWRQYAEKLGSSTDLKGSWKRRAAVLQSKTSGSGGWARRQAPKELPAPWTRQIAEELLYGAHGSWMRRAVEGTPPYDPDAIAFFARLTNQPNAARKTLYNNLIVSLKAAGVWTKLDALYILAATDAQSARQNIVANAYNLTAAGSPTFTTDRGYTGDGVGAYLATGFNPLTASSPKFVRDSACIFAWERSDMNAATTSSIAAAAGNRTSLAPRSSGNVLQGTVNAALGGTQVVATNVGLSAVDRPNSANVLLLKDGVLIETRSAASEAVVTGDFDLMRRNGTVYRASPLTTAGFGGSLDVAGQAALRTALNAYLTAVGAV